MRKIYIYGLVDPQTNEICYVGKTSNLSNRMAQHCRQNPRSKSPRVLWINRLLGEGLRPRMITLQECNEENWQECECAFIAKYRKLSPNLTNTSKGGSGGPSKANPRTMKSFTLSPEVQKFIKDQSREMDRSQSSTLDRLVRELAKLKGYTLPSVEKAS